MATAKTKTKEKKTTYNFGEKKEENINSKKIREDNLWEKR